MALYPHQKAILRLAFPETEGRYPFTTVVYSTIKKSGKTAVTGGVARWWAEQGGLAPEIFTLANDQEQSIGRIFKAMVRSIELSPGYDRNKRILPGRWKIAEHHAYHLPNYATVSALSHDYAGEAGANPSLTLWCVSGDTEILTIDGWKPATEITVSDALATLDADDRVVYEHPTAVKMTPYSGDMIRFEHRRVEFLVTPCHRAYGRFVTNSRYRRMAERRGWWFEEAGAIESGRYSAGWLRADSMGYGMSCTDCSTEEAKFLGYWIAEGHIQRYRGRPVYVHVGQSISANPETHRRIGEAMRAIGLDARLTQHGWRARAPALAEELAQFGYSHERFIPPRILHGSTAAQRAFLMGYLEGDGWRAGKEGWQAQTTSRRLADDLMQLALHCGWVPRFMGEKKRGAWKPIYRLSFTSGPIYWQRSGGHGKWSREHYDGTVVCPSLPTTGLFYIRYHGKCCWTGNSEIWGFKYEESRRLWEELTPVPTRPNSMRWVETYAGFEGESDLLWHLYDLSVLTGHQLTLGELHDRAGNGEDWSDPEKAPFLESKHPSDTVPVWMNDTARLMAYWDSGDIARRMPWQQGELGGEYYEAQAKDLRPHAFERLHRNQWVSPESAFIPMEWWDRQAAPDICTAPRLGTGESWQDGAFERTPMILGCDAAVSGDCFGVVLVSRRPGHPDQVAMRYSWKFDPPAGGKIDYGPIEELIRVLCKRYNVVQIAYDAYQLHEMMTRLTQQGVAWCRSFSQAGDRLLADKQLYDLIRDGRVWHDGSLAMREHVAAANAKMGKDEDTRLRIVKKAESRKIDLVVALSMAAYECMRLNLA